MLNENRFLGTFRGHNTRINRGIFTDFPIFVESFPDLQSRIFICNSVDELLDAMFSQEVETGLLKILVLGSEEYILNNSETVDKPWNNCILVGTRKKCSVSLKSNYHISLLKCMFTNLSFSFNECRLFCLPDSFVKILNCNFTSNDDNIGTIKTEGVFNAEQCSFTRSPLVCVKQSRAVVHDCSFCNNAKDELCVVEGGTLKVENCRMYNNGDDGLFVGDKSECVVANCDIHDNGGDGIDLSESGNVTLIRNNISNNSGRGIRINVMYGGVADVRENSLSDNGMWGIHTCNSDCNILTNKIFRNNDGGVNIQEYRILSSVVVKLNKICHNGGPGLRVNGDVIKVAEWLHLNSANSVESFEFQNNEIHDNKENESDGKLNLSVPYCSYCRVKCKPTMCQKCLTTAYCSESCQKQHYSKHKEICKVLREKSSYLITSTEEADKDDLYHDGEYVGEDEVGPKLSSLLRDAYDMRFVVRVHHLNPITNYAAQRGPFVLYHRNSELCVKFNSKVINRMLKEFGVPCRSLYLEKKLFFHCLGEDNGQLRLFTNEFAEFQNW